MKGRPLASRERGEAGRRVPAELGGSRLDAVARTLFELSWGETRRLVARGKVFVDGEAGTDPERPVAEGSEIELRREAPRRRAGLDLGPERVVHLDRDIAVVDKPPGLSTVPYERGEHGVLVDLVRRHVRRVESGSLPRGVLPALHVVQRLDRGTSGLLVFARNATAARSLREQLLARSVRRRYLAVAHGRVATATYRTHVVKDRGDGLRGSRETARSPRRRDDRRGKLAVTHVEAKAELRGATLLECRLETGRTHQIRVHLSEAGHPLVGETIYLRGYDGPVIEATRLMLHAAELAFVHPATGQAVRFEREMPEDMALLVRALRPK